MRIACGVAVSLIAVSSALAGPMLGDPINGKVFAQAVCADCHNVEEAPGLLSTDEPRSFRGVAEDPKYTDTALRVFLSTTHAIMPNFIMTRKQTDDLVAYIASLRVSN